MEYLTKMLRKNKKGLTLVEILVVILIIGILIAALLPRVNAAIDKSRETQVKTDFRNFSLAAESMLREYSGFGGAPVIDETGKQMGTISEIYWTKKHHIGQDSGTIPAGTVAEVSTAGKGAVTASLIEAMNKYLESTNQFSADVNADTFGKSKSMDPWKQPYEVYFVARDGVTGDTNSTLSDRIFITSFGKTQDSALPDYTLLVQYKKGEVKSAMSGFSGETYDGDTDYVTGEYKGSRYTVLQDLFVKAHGETTTMPDNFLAIGATVTSPFKYDTGKNVNRLYITMEDDATSKNEKLSGVITAIPFTAAP